MIITSPRAKTPISIRSPVSPVDRWNVNPTADRGPGALGACTAPGAPVPSTVPGALEPRSPGTSSGGLGDQDVATGLVGHAVGDRTKDPPSAPHALAAHDDEVRSDLVGPLDQHLCRVADRGVDLHVDALDPAGHLVEQVPGRRLQLRLGRTRAR